MAARPPKSWQPCQIQQAEEGVPQEIRPAGLIHCHLPTVVATAGSCQTKAGSYRRVQDVEQDDHRRHVLAAT